MLRNIMFCVKCGAENPPEAAFCHKCGRPSYSPTLTSPERPNCVTASVAGVHVPQSAPPPISPIRSAHKREMGYWWRYVLRRPLANILVALFVLMIISASSQAGKTHLKPGDTAGAIGGLTGYLLLFVGLYYSARWSIKLSGHTHKVGSQTVATILFWYSVFAALISLIMPLYTRTT